MFHRDYLNTKEELDMKKYIPWMIGAACIAAMAVAAIILVPGIRTPQAQKPIEQFGYAVEGQPMIEQKEISHSESEDYEIKWADPALEQMMRLYLEKPEGPILHSDVWDIQAVYLRNPYRFFTDAESADGYLPETGGVVTSEPLSQITMLEDFRHFDSLQLLELNGQKLTDLAGLEKLSHLNTLNFTDCGIADTEPLRQLAGVTKLVLDDNPLTDAETIGGMSSLNWLSMRGCGLIDITPLSRLTGLTWLDVSNTIQGEGTIADYTPIAELGSLTYLGMGNITDLTDISFCSGLKKLETVDLKNSGVDKIDAKRILTQVKTLLI